MMRRTVLLASALVLVLAGCGGGDDTAVSVPDTASTQSAAAEPTGAGGMPTMTDHPTAAGTPAPGTEITTASSPFGEMLFDGTKQAIYLFDKETDSTPRCYDACAKAWPPVLTDGAPKATGDTKASLLGTTRRTDGSVQVTYAGAPLYFYAHEKKNEVKCHNVRDHGGLWLVVTPGGEPAPV